VADVNDAVSPLLSQSADDVQQPKPSTVTTMPRASAVSDFAASAGYTTNWGGSRPAESSACIVYVLVYIVP
jgi:hypothetical protein